MSREILYFAYENVKVRTRIFEKFKELVYKQQVEVFTYFKLKNFNPFSTIKCARKQQTYYSRRGT